ncbi:MAG: hypothetical protein M1826_005588 [Phylliscum demangeonii]|nr:MAG: hypothetical protein M1826_005588 [Phylliscum demangeonii]
MCTSHGIVIFSGGSAANSFVDDFNAFADKRNCALTYAVAISDNGGSSSELIRVFGGPSVGDLRSRLVRLIPSHPPTPEKAALKALFNHRLSSSTDAARLEWLDIVESRSKLWDHVASSKKEVIRSFLNLLNQEIVKRARPPRNTFNFQSASIGNMFLTGARLFCGSFEAAVYLLGSVAGVSEGVHVLPAVNSNFSHHISAGLADGSVIVGQNAISHPSVPTAMPAADGQAPASYNNTGLDADVPDGIEDAYLPGSLPTLRQQNIAFAKDADEPLPSRIDRIWYINPYGQEMRPAANPKILDALSDAHCVIYSIGSLYTSIVPCLILRGIGDALLSPHIRYKILILNGSLDRETGPEPFTATDFVHAIVRACYESRDHGDLSQSESAAPATFKTYVTHLIHLEGDGTPLVDRAYLRSIGIECQITLAEFHIHVHIPPAHSNLATLPSNPPSVEKPADTDA